MMTLKIRVAKASPIMSFDRTLDLTLLEEVAALTKNKSFLNMATEIRIMKDSTVSLGSILEILIAELGTTAAMVRD